MLLLSSPLSSLSSSPLATALASVPVRHLPLLQKLSEVTQSCPTLCDPVDCSLPGSSVHGILQARILEWVAISFSRGSSQPRIEHASLMSPALAGRSCTPNATWEAILICIEGIMIVSILGLDEIIYLAQCLEHRAAVFYQTSRMKLSIPFYFSSGYLEPAHT